MIEYVPLNIRENNTGADPSSLPDYLGNVIYFPTSNLAPFLAKMIGHLYRKVSTD